MERRRLLRGGAGVLTAGVLAGCGSLEADRQLVREPPLLTDRPDAIYLPTHADATAVAGTATAGPYEVTVVYSHPHRFWTVAGTTATKRAVDDDRDDRHLMATVRDRETGLVVPETGVSLAVTRDDEVVAQKSAYAMLSQRMGFHYGDNVPTEGPGTYEVAVRVGALAAAGVRRTGAFRDRFEEPATATVPVEFSEDDLAGLDVRLFDEAAGERRALEPMAMENVPTAVAPAADALPGTVRTTMADDVRFVVTVLSETPAGVDGDGPYLAVSPRTRYNGLALHSTGLSVTRRRDGEAVERTELVRTFDPDLAYHYGATVASVAEGDVLAVAVTTPPQVTRHEGYETAFFGRPTVEVRL